MSKIREVRVAKDHIEVINEAGQVLQLSWEDAQDLIDCLRTALLSAMGVKLPGRGESINGND